MSSRRKLLMGCAIVALSLMAATPAGAQERPNGPTAGDFIVDGEFDQAGYLAAFIAFQTAPDVAAGAPLDLTIHQCEPGDLASAELLGYPETLVSGTVPASAVITLTMNIPADTELGFNRIRVSCATQSGMPHLVKDVVINVVPFGTASAVLSLDIYMIAEPTAGGGGTGAGGLPQTGREVRQSIGIGIALLLVGAALVGGVRQRLHHDPTAS